MQFGEKSKLLTFEKMSDLEESRNPQVIRAREFVCKTQWRELLSFSQRWAMEEPESWLPHYFIGGAASNLGLYELAISSTLNALFINKLDQRIWENLATIYEEKGELSRSMEILQEGIKCCSEQKNVKLLLAAGNYMGRTGQDSEALRYFEQALSNDPECLEAINGISIALQKLDRIPALLNLISNNVTTCPHLAAFYNRLTQDLYTGSRLKKWVLGNFNLSCLNCQYFLEKPEVLGFSSYFLYNNILVQSVRGVAFCPQCSKLTTGAQEPKPITIEQLSDRLDQSRVRLDAIPKTIKPTSLLHKFFRIFKANQEWLDLQNRIKQESDLMEASDYFKADYECVHCESCGGLDAYFVQNMSLITSTNTLSNVKCPKCESLMDLVGKWEEYVERRFQPWRDDEDEKKGLYWIVGCLGAKKLQISNPVVFSLDDSILSMEYKYHGRLCFSGNLIADSLLYNQENN